MSSRIGPAALLAAALLAGGPSALAEDAPPPLLPAWWEAERRVEGRDVPRTEGPGDLTVIGQVSVSPEEARKDAQDLMDQAVHRWLEPEVAPGWRAPRHLLDLIAKEVHVEATKNPHANDPAFADYPTLYQCGLLGDLSEVRRSELLGAHRREVVNARLWRMGLGLGFLLTCLGAHAVYVRADESTRGYFTNRLRLLAVGLVGGAGAAAYFLS